MRQIFLDTETTGLNADSGDRIIEIGCVELLNRKLSGSNFHHYVNPERASHEDAIRVHGISNEFLQDKPRFAAIADDLIEYLRGAELIIHNASFDIGFLDREFERLGKPPVSELVASVVDTLAMAREVYPGKRNSLDALCDRLGVDNSARSQHGALLDAELLAEVYICLTRGQEALLIDSGGADARQEAVADVDLSTVNLPVVYASAQESAAHEDLLRQLDKASSGATVWRRNEAPSQVPMA